MTHKMVILIVIYIFFVNCQQQDFASFQPRKVKFEFTPVVPAATKFLGTFFNWLMITQLLYMGKDSSTFKTISFSWIFQFFPPIVFVY